MTVPDTARSEEIVNALIKDNVIKSHDDSGNRIRYRLEHSDTGRVLQGYSTLQNANISDKDLLFLLTIPPDSILGTKFTTIARAGSIASGLGLIGLGIWDGITNPFNFMESKELFVAGVGLITIGINSDKKQNKT